MRTVRDIPVFARIPILVRAALNVPLDKNGEVANAYRLRRALPTLQYLTERGARVIVISHIGEKGTETLAPVAKALATLHPNVSFCPDTLGERARSAVRELLPGQVLVLENLRRNKGETANDPVFAKELAALADIFVEDSFDTCHRPHASIIGVPQLLPSYAGLTLEEEIRELTGALTPARPALAVIGGAKFSTKEPVITALSALYEHTFVGGALANDFIKASGHEVGKSLTSNADPVKIAELLKNPRIMLPMDFFVVKAADAQSPDARARAIVRQASTVAPDEMILDHGPATSALLAGLSKQVNTILWNGPLGDYEKGFTDATDNLARAIAASGAHSIIGGGDTIAAIDGLNLSSHFSFLSTGGGAMLEFLTKGTLPGIAALS